MTVSPDHSYTPFYPALTYSCCCAFLGWCKTLRKLIEIGYLADAVDETIPGKTYAQLIAKLIGKPESTNVKADTAARLGLAVDHKIISTIEWLGLFSNDDKVRRLCFACPLPMSHF